jgi:acetyl-CoA acyltransferase
LQHQHCVRDGHVFEVLVARLERLEHVLDGLHVANPVSAGREVGERVAYGLWEVLARADGVGVEAGGLVVSEDEAGERSRVAADRGVRLGRARVEGEARFVAGGFPVARQQSRLHRADRPSPAGGWRVREALAIALGRPREPFACLVAPSGHEQGEPRAVGGVRQPRQLALADVGIVGVRKSLLSFAVPLLLTFGLGVPVLHDRSILTAMGRRLGEVFFVDGVRTAFGRAGPKGVFWRTRADDMAVKATRELLRRNPELPPERIGDVIFAATAQVGDQGLTLGRDVALLAGIPQSVPGFAVDRMCAGSLTAVTAGAGEIAMGAADVVLAGGVEHMGHHPMGDDVDFNPRFVAERLVDESAVTMGATAENLHDRFPDLTKEDADAYAVRSQQRATAAWQDGLMRETVVAMSVFTDDGWTVADRDEFLRPDTSMDGLADLPTPFRSGGRVTAGNSAGLTDGATVGLLASESAVEELGLEPRMRLVGFAYAGVEPELMGIGPVPATRRALEHAGIRLDDVGLFELNEPFAVQVLTWCDGMGVSPDDERLNPYGGAIACGHPLAATGVRLLAQLAYGFKERPDVRYGLTALCIGMGMGAALLWENVGA